MKKPEIRDEDWNRFLRLRECLFKAIGESLEIGGHCKSYEGRFDIEVSLPNYFEGDEKKPMWCLHLACYLIGSHRGVDWYGESFHSVLKSAEKDLIDWLENHKEWMDQFRAGKIKTLNEG